ncbi:MAG: FtsQ-type POTRA domain-containing protein [Chloroflexi bacterium]|nr:FtsQ-type POTRA domain-containing protein [Chloroflexota bacterium]
MPSIRRLLAGVGAVAAAAGLIAAVNGPWFRVADVVWAGDQFTSDRDLERILDGHDGVSLLAVDTRSLAARLERLPAVADATVTAKLPDTLDVAIQEREAAFVWQTTTAQLLGDADGRLFAAMPVDASLPEAQHTLPRIVDQRSASRLMTPGDEIPDMLLGTALRLADLDPASLGSSASRLAVRLDDEYGFRLVAADAWELALGVYGMDPDETPAHAAARLERQVTAVRTLFASRPETEISWVDARNPGKVYFRAKG